MAKILDHEKLVMLRKRKGWTQAQLAVKLGVKAPDVSKYEVETIKRPSADKLKCFAEALGVKPDDLLKEENPESLPGVINLRPELCDLTKQLLALTEEDMTLVYSYVQMVYDLTGRKPKK